MKKIMLLLVFIFAAAVSTACIVNAENEYLVTDSFEEITELPAGFSVNNALAEIAQYSAELPAIESAVKVSGASDSYTTLTLSFAPVAVSGESGTENCFIVTEFDILTENLSKTTANITLRFADTDVATNTSKNMKSLQITHGNKLKIENGDNLADFESISKWNRLRFVMRITDEKGNFVREITQIYINGLPVLTNAIAFETQGQEYDTFRISLSKKTGDFGFWIDNFKVEKHYTENYKNIPDSYALFCEINKSAQFLASDEGNCLYTTVEAENYEAAIKAAATTMRTAGVSANSLYFTEASLRYIRNMHLFQYAGMNVLGKDGIRRNNPQPGALLESVIFEKKHGDKIKGDMKLAVFSSDGMLQTVESIPVELGEETGFVEIETGFTFDDEISSKDIKLFFWGRELVPLTKSYIYDVCTPLSFSFNEKQIHSGVMPVLLTSGDAYVPAKLLINQMGMELQKSDGTYKAVREDGNSVEFTTTSDICIINGTEKRLQNTPYLFDGSAIMLPMSVLCEAFGVEYSLGSDFAVSYSFAAPSYETTPEGLVEYNSDIFTASYVINCNDSDAVVEVWYKDKNYAPDNIYSLYWHKAHTPVYSNGAFHGAIGGLSKSRSYDIKISITDSTGTKTYVDASAVKTKNYIVPAYDETLYETNGELLLVPTFENIGYYIDNDINASKCEIFYRISGSDAWQKAYAPYIDTVGKQFRGSIVNLMPGIEYEVRAILFGEDGAVLSEKTSSTKMWGENPVIAQVIKLSEIYEGDSLLLANIRGSENGWIKVINDADITVNGGSELTEAVLVDNCEYLIIEGLKVKGGYRYGINVANTSKNVRIVNCDVSDWGRCGVLDEASGLYYTDGATINYDAAIVLLDAENVVVERCYVHDSNAKTNAWRGKTWKDVHPKGSEAIYYCVNSGVVIRYNDFVGGDVHRFNDAIEGYSNGSRFGGASRDTDIYGNTLLYCEDDGVEIDGAQMNTRVYRNRIEQAMCGISTAPNLTGPSYIFENLMTNLGTPDGNISGAAFKSGGMPNDGITGIHYIFNNTVDSLTAGLVNMNWNNSREYHAITRNNIFVTRSAGKFALENTFANERDSNDYNLIFGNYQTKDDDGVHSIYNILPDYISLDNADFRLNTQYQGEYLQNFSESENPLIGALGSDDRYMPYRPVDMYADKYRIDLSNNETAKITVSFGSVGSNRTCSLVKNEECEWLEIDCEYGVSNIPVNENSTFTFVVRADMTKCNATKGCGAVLIRLDNGYSIPVTVQGIK